MPAPSMIIAIDQGTTSTRAIVLDQTLKIVEQQQISHSQISAQPGYLEHDPEQIFSNVQTCLSKLAVSPRDIYAVGITNQRETTICWDKQTGQPLHNAIVWSDVRTADLAVKIQHEAQVNGINIQQITGLRVSTYFSGLKMRWLIENVPAVAEAAANKTCCFGTVDAYLMYKLSQYDTNGPTFKTDVTNASRTLMMDIRRLDWDDRLLTLFKVSRDVLPQICPSGGLFCEISVFPFKGAPIQSVLGDQQAALYGHQCLQAGTAMCTFGTGAFLLVNTGQQVAVSTEYLATVFYQRHGEAPCYALEGSVASAGANFEYLKKIGILQDFSELENLVDCQDVQVLAAPQGLLAPFWNPNVCMCLDGFNVTLSRAQVVTAAAIGVCQMVKVIVHQLGARFVKIGGGLTKSEAFCQLLADVIQIAVQRGETEATAIGVGRMAAEMAGLAIFEDQSKKYVYTSHTERNFDYQLEKLIKISQI